MTRAMPRATIGEILRATLQTSRQTHTESVYDQVLREVSARIAEQGSMGKADIGALVVWKRLNAQTTWAKSLMETPDDDVRAATARAYALASDESELIPVAGGAARSALLGVPGMGGTDAMASAVLLAMSPTRMAVWDRRVETALTAIGRKPKGGRGRYERYLGVVIELAEAMQEVSDNRDAVIPREVDLALYHAAGNPDVLERLRHASGRSKDAQ